MKTLAASCAIILAAACASDKSALPGTSAVVDEAAIAWPDGPVASVPWVDAPGLDVEALTRVLGDAFASGSGLPTVDALGVRNELAACVQMPCVDELQQRLARAELLVTASVSRVGPQMLASVRVVRGLREIARANAAEDTASAALTTAGRAAARATRAAHSIVLPPSTSTPSAER